MDESIDAIADVPLARTPSCEGVHDPLSTRCARRPRRRTITTPCGARAPCPATGPDPERATLCRSETGTVPGPDHSTRIAGGSCGSGPELTGLVARAPHMRCIFTCGLAIRTSGASRGRDRRGSWARGSRLAGRGGRRRTITAPCGARAPCRATRPDPERATPCRSDTGTVPGPDRSTRIAGGSCGSGPEMKGWSRGCPARRASSPLALPSEPAVRRTLGIDAGGSASVAPRTPWWSSTDV